MLREAGAGLAIALRNFLAAETGTTAIEYAMIAGLISVAVIGGVTLLGGNVATIYNNLPLHFG
jgi:pilus assembly protein Flp/PilA